MNTILKKSTVSRLRPYKTTISIYCARQHRRDSARHTADAGFEINNSVLAEHGFCALVTLTADNQSRSLLFDFGFSKHGAAFNADALNLDLTKVEALVLSHGHPDHTGGLKSIARKLRGRNRVFGSSRVFRQGRYQKITEELKVRFPRFTGSRYKTQVRR